MKQLIRLCPRQDGVVLFVFWFCFWLKILYLLFLMIKIAIEWKTLGLFLLFIECQFATGSVLLINTFLINSSGIPSPPITDFCYIISSILLSSHKDFFDRCIPAFFLVITEFLHDYQDFFSYCRVEFLMFFKLPITRYYVLTWNFIWLLQR